MERIRNNCKSFPHIPNILPIFTNSKSKKLLTMLTYHNIPQLKEQAVSEMKEHQRLDRIVQGHWHINDPQKGFTGCFHGCLLNEPAAADPRAATSEKFGLPLWYTYVTEKIFEGLPENEAIEFSVTSLEVLPVGLDMNKAISLFYQRMLTGQLQFVDEGSEQEAAIKQCIELFSVPFNQVDQSDALWARTAAWRADSDARTTWSAVRSAAVAAWSAECATRAPAWSAECASRSAAAAANSDANSDAYYTKLRDFLFEAIRESLDTQEVVNG